MHIIGMHGHPRRIADPYVYKFLRRARRPRHERVHDLLARSAGHDADHHRLQLHRQPASPARRPEPTPGTPTPWSGRPPRRPRTTTSPPCPRCTTPLTSTASPAWSKTSCPRPSPGPPRPDLWIRSWLEQSPDHLHLGWVERGETHHSCSTPRPQFETMTP